MYHTDDADPVWAGGSICHNRSALAFQDNVCSVIRHLLGVRYERTGTVPNSHTPTGNITLYFDEHPVGTLPDVITHPGTFGLAGAGITVGRNGGSGVSSRYKAPFIFTGGTIAQVTVDLSGRPYEDVEKDLALAFSRD